MPGEFHGQKRLAGYSPWDRKESDMTEHLTHTLMVSIKMMNPHEGHSGDADIENRLVDAGEEIEGGTN